jgi:hypothetical protein
MTQDYQGIDVIYLQVRKGRIYHVDIAKFLKDLLYNDIPITFYINNEHVMDGDHNGVNVKYFPCMFETYMFWMSQICLKICCRRISLGNFMFTTHMTILAQYDH